MNQGARNGEALALSPGQVWRPLFDIGFVTVRHPLDKFLGARQARGAHRVRECQPRASRDDVVPDRTAEEKIALQDYAEALPQMAKVDVLQVAPVDLEKTAVVTIEALQQTGDG